MKPRLAGGPLSKGGVSKVKMKGEEGAFAVDCRTCVDDGRSKLRCMDFAEKSPGYFHNLASGSARHFLGQAWHVRQ
jgi:hypothetical protein